MMEEYIKIAMRDFGVTVEQAVSAIKDLSTYLPPFTEEDIARVKMNPSLSVFDKIRIIKGMRKQMQNSD